MRRHRLLLGLGGLVVAAIAVAVALAAVGGGSGGSQPGPPKFHPAPGRFRVTPRLPGNGAPPQPTLLANGSSRVLVAFGGAVREHGRPLAGMVLTLPGSDRRAAGRYPAGAVIPLGPVRVTVLGVYDEPGTAADAVDLHVSAG